MVELAEIFRRAGATFRRAFEHRMSPWQRQAMRDITACRTPALGGSVYACDACGGLDYAYHSCRNRHCPKCQADRAQAWLERVRARLLPCEHYMITFTLPSALRAVARSHPQFVYGTLLREAAATVQALAVDPQWIGARVAILAALHTWSRTMALHPHGHLLVSAGGLAADGAWVKPAHPRFLMPGYVLSHLFRSRMKDAFTRAGLAGAIDPKVWTGRWAVHVKRIGSGHHATLYLSRYVYRVALGNERIEAFTDGNVTFRYTESKTGHTRRMTLAANDFIARFLQHILPAGFAKIRYYGLLSPSAADELAQARRLLEAAAAGAHAAGPAEPAGDTAAPAPSRNPDPTRRCPHCHAGPLRLHGSIARQRAPP
jgi:hypothetical protein